MHDVFLLTKLNYPITFKAFEIISHDCGRQAGHVNYAVPLMYKKYMEQIEKDLTKLLTNKKLDEFCIGEESEMKSLIEKFQIGKITDELTQRFFEEFQ